MEEEREVCEELPGGSEQHGGEANDLVKVTFKGGTKREELKPGSKDFKEAEGVNTFFQKKI